MNAQATVQAGTLPAKFSTSCIQGLPAVEEALENGPLREWGALLDRDPTATLFQSPVWCMPWYRSYENFEPQVLAIRCGGTLAGVVPLAIEKPTGRLTFAGDNMTDYRDLVTLPEFRREVAGEFLRYYKHGGFPNVLHFGSTLPESETPTTLLSIAPSFGVRTFARSNYGWRWSPHEQTEDPLKKKSVRYPINYFRRQGRLEAEHVHSEERWQHFQREFYIQHSLRQISAGRPVSMNDVHKRSFFDRLFHSAYGHITALWLNDELIAGHIGAVYKRVLYWGAPSFDVRYRQYSPNLVLLVLTMKNGAQWGFDGIDLTIGKGDLKERFSTSRVDLPWIELYARPRAYYMRATRAAAVRATRSVVERIGDDKTWDQRVKPAAEKVAFKFMRVREMGPARSVAHTARLLSHVFGEHTRGLVFIARPEDIRDVSAVLNPGEQCEYHDNDIRDLAKRESWTGEAAREIEAKVRSFADTLRTNRTFHTVVVNDRLAAWGYSYWPTETARLTEVGGIPLEFEPDSVSLYDFYTLPEFRGRKLYPSLLTYILRKRFAEGASQAYITVLADNVASRKAIERVGFRAVRMNEVTRVLKWKKLQSREL